MLRAPDGYGGLLLPVHQARGARRHAELALVAVLVVFGKRLRRREQSGSDHRSQDDRRTVLLGNHVSREAKPADTGSYGEIPV
jgi:hypothetical protein